MQPNNEKREALERAEKLLAQNDDAALMYTALELRRCLEAVVYEKLWAYRTRISAAAAQKWQPPQAFRALLAIEPDAAKSSVVRFAVEETPGGEAVGPFSTLGTDLRPSPNWLNKTYNKLGSVLHAHWPYARTGRDDDPQKLRTYLNKVAVELEPYATHSFTSTLAVTVTFECTVCGEAIIANSLGAEAQGEVLCLNSECGCRYFCTKQGEKVGFRLDASGVDCPDCGHSMQIPNQKLAVGYEFECAKCGSPFEVAANSWDFRKRKSA